MFYRFDIGDVTSDAEKNAVFFIGQGDGKKVLCSVSWEILRTYFSDGEDEEEDPLMYNPFWWYFNNQHVFQQKAQELINIGRFEEDGSIVLELQDVYQVKESENDDPKPRIARQELPIDGLEPGFVKGTLVHTREGKRPIDQIKVGDYVLSSPEEGTGKPEYKRVKNVFVHQEKSIRKVYIYGPNSQFQFSLGATGNHRFWVEGIGWTRADKLQQDQVFRRADGSFAEVARQLPVYRTGRDGVGWVQMLSNVEGSYGSVFDFENFAVVPLGQDEYLSEEVYNSDDPFLKVTVYNLEVEDFRTYYICGEGYWVHDQYNRRVS